jgi:ribonuclease HII
VERELLQNGSSSVAGLDEVGRGALCGPVTVGVVVVDATIGRVPRGLRDSKLLSPAARRALVPRIEQWASAVAVGEATASEIDEHGLIVALRVAAHRALRRLPERPGCLLLDGSHDYVSPPDQQLQFGVGPEGLLAEVPVVHTRIRADLRCAAVAAASVLAKVHRDAVMDRLASDHPEFAWQQNKGYATPAHREALRHWGPTPVHRRSWRLG